MIKWVDFAMYDRAEFTGLVVCCPLQGLCVVSPEFVSYKLESQTLVYGQASSSHFYREPSLHRPVTGATREAPGAGLADGLAHGGSGAALAIVPGAGHGRGREAGRSAERPGVPKTQLQTSAQ